MESTSFHIVCVTLLTILQIEYLSKKLQYCTKCLPKEPQRIKVLCGNILRKMIRNKSSQSVRCAVRQSARNMVILQIYENIESKHKLVFAELSKLLTASRASKRQQAAQDSAEGPSMSKCRKMDSYLKERKWFPTDKRQKNCTEKLAQMICLDLQPISIVEDQGFKDFVGCLQPSYNIPDRRVLRNNVIPELFQTQKSYLQQKLNEIKSFVITLDHWTSTAQDAYMAVTAHFLSEDFTINDYCLNVRHMPQSHDAKNISDELCSRLHEWIPD